MKEATGYYVTIGSNGKDIMQFQFNNEADWDKAIKGLLLGSSIKL